MKGVLGKAKAALETMLAEQCLWIKVGVQANRISETIKEVVDEVDSMVAKEGSKEESCPFKEKSSKIPTLKLRKVNGDELP